MNPSTYVCLGRKIANLRRDLGLTQRELAEKAGISPSYLGKLERGAGTEGTSLEVLYKVAQSLDLEADTLLKFNKIDVKKAQHYLYRQRMREQRRQQAF